MTKVLRDAETVVAKSPQHSPKPPARQDQFKLVPIRDTEPETPLVPPPQETPVLPPPTTGFVFSRRQNQPSASRHAYPPLLPTPDPPATHDAVNADTAQLPPPPPMFGFESRPAPGQSQEPPKGYVT